MTKDNALKLALEALEESETNNDTMEFHDRKNNAISAVKQALAAPTVQEMTNIQRHEQNVQKFVDAQPAPVQEPSTRACRSCGGSGERDTGIAESPTAICRPCSGTGQITTQSAAPVQEPVAWIRWEWNRSGLRSLTFSKPAELPLAEEATGVVYDPLYPTPPEAPTVQEPVECIRSLTDQCDVLIRERDELQKQVWRYEKHGVTCQTYGHKVESSCSECNVHDDYTTPPKTPVQEPDYNICPTCGGMASDPIVPPLARLAPVQVEHCIWARNSNTPCPHTAAQRQWVGLTDEEFVDFVTSDEYGTAGLIAAVVTKLKEKNNG